MRILIDKLMMQRYKTFVQILDSLVEEGHKVYAREHGLFDPEVFKKTPMDVSCASGSSLAYLNNHFGFSAEHLARIKWDPPGPLNYDCLLSADWKGVSNIPKVRRELDVIENGRTPSKQVNIPHNGVHCYTSSGPTLVGSGMSHAIKESQKFIGEKNQLLIIHPGGGRGMISPIRKHFPKWDVVRSNIKFLNKVLSYIPPNIEKVSISTHASPYSYCDAESLRVKVLPRLESPCEVQVEGGNLITRICSSKFILMFGSSTCLWLLGSPKRWINITNSAQYSLDSPKRRDTWEWTENWWNWPQNIPFEALGEVLQDYDSTVNEFTNFELEEKYFELEEKYAEIYNLDFLSLVMEVIHGSK